MRTPNLVSKARRRLALGTRLRAAESQVLATRYARWRTQPVRERTVLYESFSGNGLLDNPEAIFRYLLTAPDMADLEHIWALNDPAAYPGGGRGVRRTTTGSVRDDAVSRVLQGPGHVEVPGEQRDLPAGVREASATFNVQWIGHRTWSCSRCIRSSTTL